MKLKKILCLCAATMLMLSLFGCGKKDAEQSSAELEVDTFASSESAAEAHPQAEGIDVDLTQLSSTMMYSEVYNMLGTPEDYVGKTIKMSGQLAVYIAPNQKYYYAVMIADATACCQQGLEFILKVDSENPEDYPKAGTEVTVVGQFQTYQEEDLTYCHLVDAELTVLD
ncbi:MAG: hypothetical protein EOM28_12540 [Clostridia bacterium]|nr:hypothetical protein [Clostridia bacterium]